MAIEVMPVGEHALIDIEGALRLDDPVFLERVMREAALAARACVVGANIHPFGEGQGVTGVLLLAESHISVHTWPEYGFAAFDIFMCGSALVGQAIGVIEHAFPEAAISTRTVVRGAVMKTGSNSWERTVATPSDGASTTSAIKTSSGQVSV